MSNVGKNIKKLRIRKKMTQEEMAERLFVSRQTVSNYENHKSNPDVDMLVRIAEILETDVNTLIYGEAVPPERKKQIRKWIVLCLFTIVYGIFVAFLTERTQQWIRRTYFGEPMIVIKGLLQPLLFCMLGYTIMETVFLIFSVQSRKSACVRWVFRGAFGLLLLYVLLFLPYAIQTAVETVKFIQWHNAGLEGTFPWEHWLPSGWERMVIWFTGRIIYQYSYYPGLFLIPGLVLRASNSSAQGFALA
ncbi:MAG: helix-turn-helix transcriptional regulator, partial [Lachnospiraceae bacterium]|nr:helix-turn-helix transcriptional regulator [Lachnospiraceae bacterium]